MKRRKQRWRWRIDMDVLRCVLFFSFLVLVLAVLGLLANGIVIVVRMCLRGSALGFALLAAVILLVAGFFIVRRILIHRFALSGADEDRPRGTVAWRIQGRRKEGCLI